jgi:hypothetical protein
LGDARRAQLSSRPLRRIFRHFWDCLAAHARIFNKSDRSVKFIIDGT